MRKDMMRWDDLRVFLAVAREGQLNAAGRALGLDPTTAGRRIGALEAVLGTRLFDRSPEGYALTEAGRGLVAHAEAIEVHARAAAEAGGEAAAGAGGAAPRLSGTVRIGAPDGVSNYLLLDACDALSRENPALQVQVVALPRIFSISKREADLTITVAPPVAGRLTVHKVADYHLRLYARADLVAPLGPVRSLADLRGLRGIGYISDLIFDQQLDYYALLGRGDEPALTSNSLMTQLRWCRRGAGVCILPEFVGREYPELAVLLPAEVRLTRAFYLVRHLEDARVERINRIAEVVVDSMRAALEDGPRFAGAP